MKILQAALSYEKGGRTRRIVDLGNGLKAKGHDVGFFAMSPPPLWIQEKHPVLRDTITPASPRSSTLMSIADFMGQIKKFKPDLIHAHCATTRTVASISGKLMGVPVVGTFHHSGLKPYSNTTTNRLVARLLSHNVAISSNRMEMMAQNLGITPDRLTLIHGGTHLVPVVEPGAREQFREQLKIPANQLALLSMGHLGKIKGHDFVIEAMPAVVQRFPQVHLYIGGQGAEKDLLRLQGLIDQLGIGNNVTLLGEVDPQPWYDACDVFVLASIEEGFGLVFIEAGACKLPVVATNIGGIRDIVLNEETGFLVPVRDASAISQALLTLLEKPELRTRYGEAGRKRVEENFIIDNMVEKYLRIYQKLTGLQ